MDSVLERKASIADHFQVKYVKAPTSVHEIAKCGLVGGWG